jgi:hypothetical protein
MFGIDSQENLPPLFFHSHKAWDAFMAQIWARFFAHFKLATQAAVVEIGPGSSIKIGIALAETGFKGTVYLVDPFEEELARTAKLYRDLLPDAHIHVIAHSLAGALELLPKHLDFLVSNHPIDDMLLASGKGKKELLELFGWTAIEHEQMVPASERAWRVLSSDRDRLLRMKEAVYSEWHAALEMLRPDIAIISQYPSSTLNNNGMEGLNMHAADIFARIRAEYKEILETGLQPLLNASKHYNDRHIGTEVLNAKNWLALSMAY